MTNELDLLIKLDARSQWSDEASKFTPWLAHEDNMSLLSEALGVELEVEDEVTSIGV